MKIIISPAKTMQEGSGSYTALPAYLSRTSVLLTDLREKSVAQLMRIYGCSESIASTNAKRFAKMNLHQELMKAIERYTGLQYRHIDYKSLDDASKQYLEEHLRILSAFYGMLCPEDGIVAYRLDFNSKLEVGRTRNLYGFWEDFIARDFKGEKVINLASSEFSKLVVPYLSPKEVITCEFGRIQDGKFKTASTLAKSARGEMVRWMAVNKVEHVEDLKNFSEMHLSYDESLSNAHTFVFVEKK